MKTFAKIMVCALVAVAAGGLVLEESRAQDVSVLAGQWKATNGTLHGQTVPASALQSMNLVITGTSFNATSGGLNSTGSIVLTPGKADEATFLISGGADANRQLYVKYRVAGNLLTLVFSDQAPPVDFNSTAGNKYLLMTYDKGAGAGGVVGAGAIQGAGGTGGGAGVIE